MSTFGDGVFQFGGAPVGGMPGSGGLPMVPKSGGKVFIVGNNQKYGLIATALANSHDGDLILLAPYQDFDESGLSTPAGVDHVSIVGMGPQPRSCRWRNSTNASQPHITLRGAGWVIQNVYFSGSTTDYCVELLRDATYNSSESRILKNVFNGGSGHIESNGGVSNVIISGNRFINARGGTATNPGALMATSTAQAVPTNWVVSYNMFFNCNDTINCGMSRSLVEWNTIQATGHDGACTRALCLADVTSGSAGDYNIVQHNSLGATGANIVNDNATLKYQDGANSIWVDNYATDGVDYGLPG